MDSLYKERWVSNNKKFSKILIVYEFTNRTFVGYIH